MRTSAVKERMLELNREVDWHPPEVGAGRFGEWLENNVDWALSRDRYWGTPLPVWVCDRDPSHVDVVESYASWPSGGAAAACGLRPAQAAHRHLVWRCECGGLKHRAPEVIDTWFDSGSMPYAQWHYPFEHAEEFKAHFPADFICEGVDQTRGWFYSLLAIATTVFDSTAYRHVIVNELVLDAEGQKMSKSRGNVVNPWEMIEEFGADTVRLYLLASSQVWLPKRFDRSTIKDVAGKFFNALKNSYAFFSAYAGDWRAGDAPPAGEAAVGGPLAAQPPRRHGRGGATPRGAVRSDGRRPGAHGLRGRRREPVVRASHPVPVLGGGQRRRSAALATLHEAMVTVSRLLAPAAPFASDWLHRALTGTSCTSPVSRNRPGDGIPRWRGRWKRCVVSPRWPAPPARSGACVFASRCARCRWPFRRRCGGRVRRGARAPAARGEREGSRSSRATPSSCAPAKPNFRSLGKRYGKRTPAWRPRPPALGADLAAWRRARRHPRAWTARGRLCLRTSSVEREVASDWMVGATGPESGARSRLTDELRPRGSRARS